MGWLLWRTLKADDLRQRIFLDVAIALLVVAHGLIGSFGVRESTPDDRALAALRSELAGQSPVDRWIIVAPDRSPLMLRYVLTSLWPGAESLEVESWWDERLTKGAAESGKPRGVELIVDWNDRDTRAPTLRATDEAGESHAIELTPVGTPQILWKHRLRVYRFVN